MDRHGTIFVMKDAPGMELVSVNQTIEELGKKYRVLVPVAGKSYDETLQMIRCAPVPRTLILQPGTPEPEKTDDVQALQGWLSALRIFHRESVLYGAFIWARRALNNQKWCFSAWAGCEPDGQHC
jgi:hypothetical protein